MNATKARDFFSAYYEGELGGGIKEAFERALLDDPDLKAEYEEFCATMSLLEEPAPDVEIPVDLHEKIMARLDLQAWEEKQHQKVSFWGQWRLALVGGIAAIAVIATVASLNNRAGENSIATPVPIPGQAKPAAEYVDLVADGKSLSISIRNGKNATYSLRDIADNSELGKIDVVGGKVMQSLQIESQTARAYGVFDNRNGEKLVIALPGSQQGEELKGSGNVLDLAVAIAGTFRTPIIVRAKDRDKLYSWDFDTSDDTAAISTKLNPQSLSISVREDGISILNSN